MKINRLSLLNSLFNVLNENNQGDPYFILAEYFLEHYHELSRLNIYDVARRLFCVPFQYPPVLSGDRV